MRTPSASGGRLLLALLALQALPALAHNGLPETQNVTVRRGNENDLLVGATFGALISRDKGQSWRWICPEGMGVGAWRPERYHWLSGGEIIAATGSAVVRSRDGGCSWTTHPFFKDTWATSLAVDPANERLIHVATGKYSSANGIYRSEDGGETWLTSLAPIPDTRYTAIRIAPSDPRRLYVSGQDSRGLFLSRSDDGGQTWTQLPLVLPQAVSPYDFVLRVVSEASPDILWVTVSASGGSYLLKSTDGGATLAPVLEVPLEIFIGAEASADGRTVWASTPANLFRGREGEAFSALPLPEGNACARRAGDLLYGCGSPWVHQWGLARSRDEGTTWEPLLSFKGIQGAHSCPAATPVQQSCPSLWPQLAATLGADTPPVEGQPPPADEDPSEPPLAVKDGCSAAAGLAPSALLILALGLTRHSRRLQARRP
ncbi:WD40/YVTN/BNR-like repeat-containing protein [Hyalangium rubrum]|uniref:Sialidase family protein n=1 Tax=Hyalangium rubrum TaxID=3103134 RepID=A0ABU5H8Q3_9BACT|nr:sialidase family protein [Hyalangium sp. s54d21]MDY7229862.1 sialidase family protein [Hyalangium sp. s54d21]